MKRLPYLDALRGLAILGVLLIHCGQEGSSVDLPPGIKAVTEAGAMGVVLFFIVSAFTICMSLDKEGINRDTIREFYIKRFFRIAPLYYLAIYYFSFWGYESSGKPDLTAVFLNASLLNSLFPTYVNSLVPGGWSISVEFLFYFLVPLLLVRIKSLYQCSVFIFLALGTRLALLKLFKGVLPATSDEFFLYYFLPNHLFVFGLGIFLFYLLTRHTANLLLVASFLALLLCMAFLVNTIVPDLFPYHFYFAIVFVILALYLSTGRGRFINNTFFQFLGRISYSMYIIHFIVLIQMDSLGLMDILDDYSLGGLLINLGYRYVVLLGFTVIISYYSYSFIEVPAQNFGRRIIQKYLLKQKVLSVIGQPASPVN